MFNKLGLAFAAFFLTAAFFLSSARADDKKPTPVERVKKVIKKIKDEAVKTGEGVTTAPVK